MGDNFVMTYAQEIERMKERICQTKEVNRLRYRINPRPVHYDVDPTPLCPGAHFPPLPPKLPRPEYTSTANLINIDDDDEVHFYVACEQGLLDRVVAFIRANEPSEAVLQFGLEQASFGNQPAVARCLLERGTLLHNNAFGRGEFDRRSKSRYPIDVTIFDKSEPAKDLVPLIQVYLDWGWHPNQAWCRALEDEGQTPLVIKGCLLNRPLVELLLKHGANPDIGENSLLANAEELPLKSSGGDAVNFAAQLGDISLVNLLLASGAEPRITKPFVSLVSSQVDTEQADFGRVPFSQRRSMAEHVLVAGIGGVNDVKWVPNRHGGVAYQVGSGYDTTAFAHACAAQDWEYAEWLLEKGAEPKLLDGLALRKQWWIDGLIGPNDPETVRKLVDKVKGKHLVAQ